MLVLRVLDEKRLIGKIGTLDDENFQFLKKKFIEFYGS